MKKVSFLNERAEVVQSREPILEIVDALTNALALAKRGLVRDYSMCYKSLEDECDPIMTRHWIADTYTGRLLVSGMLSEMVTDIGSAEND